MSVLDLCRNVRSQWLAFNRMVWPEDSQQLTQATLDELTADLAQRYARLLARRRRIESLHDRLGRLERRLLAQPDSESLRESIAHNRARLASLEDAYARRRLAFSRRKKLHKALLDGRVIACPLPTDADPT